ncbi:HAAS signaling domain-containing protein [Bacillus thuringiensis]|uniref:HAAS signaling domain-containing protein n=1 Tax=Bacillus thuringiensis TaxID=1428 RepID=UPI000BF80911|nr:hypothetical protein [Bacillus thuringiensis]PFJ51508.1 hypothetical protein COJ02_24645 [Bacillus thuringiensis]PFR39094.1 hypothetical protein COK27_18945 [Bacillus thuringiensis]PGL28057.1 hypothetical protein CN921_05330 [Bacillus thuringiensis]
MNSILKKYLDEISKYLYAGKEKEDILKEIEAHIMEETENNYSKITEEGLKETIKKFGAPKKVAEMYLNNTQIIAPTFKNYLFLYTSILFAVHLGLYIISEARGTDIGILPFVYLSNNSWWQIFIYIPVTFFMDFGIVCLLLFILTQSNKDINLPWFKKFVEDEKGQSVSFGIFMILLIVASIIVYKYKTLFIYINTIDDQVIALRGNGIENISYVILLLLGVTVLSYACKWFFRNDFLNLLFSIFQLTLIWFVVKLPYNEIFQYIENDQLRQKASYGFRALFILVTLIITIKFIKKIINFSVKHITKIY